MLGGEVLQQISKRREVHGDGVGRYFQISAATPRPGSTLVEPKKNIKRISQLGTAHAQTCDGEFYSAAARAPAFAAACRRTASPKARKILAELLSD
jgi:hypothetical protein